MVTIKKTKASVKFAEGNVGEIAVTRKRNKIIFSDVLGLFKVGANLEPDAVAKRPKVTLEFFTEASVDVLIAQLQELKKGFNPPTPAKSKTISTFTEEDLMKRVSMIHIKDIAIVTAYIQSHNLLNGSFFNTIDEAYEIARYFVRGYADYLPEWDSSKINLKFDEAIELFVISLKNKQNG
jgi:hypothetical protein